jgi:hypothetical protein
VFSNLEVKPIQHRRESNKAEKSLGELLVAGADALDARKEMLDEVTVSINSSECSIRDANFLQCLCRPSGPGRSRPVGPAVGRAIWPQKAY